MKRQMTFDEAVNLFRFFYDKALTNEWVWNKAAWALYQTWKEADIRNGKQP